MKKLIVLTAAVFVLSSYIAKAEGEIQKYYDVTQDGKFHYTYWIPDVAIKKGVKPITNRTFYLETVKYGVLPSTLTYREFLELSPEEIKAMLKNKSFTVKSEEISALKSTEVENIKAPVAPVEEVKIEALTEAEEISDEGQKDLPWIVEVVVEPYDGFQIPEEALKNKVVTENSGAE